MSTITIDRAHTMTERECESALDDLTQYLGEFGAHTERRGGVLSFSGKGFDGNVVIEPGRAQGQIKLGLLARPFKRQLESEINRHLDSRLGA